MAAPTKIPAYGSFTADTVANFTASGRIWENAVPLYIDSGPGMGGLKIGDGEHTWAQLPWFASGGGGGGNGIIPAVDSGVNPPEGSVSIWAPPPPDETCLGLRYADGSVAYIYGGTPHGSYLKLQDNSRVNMTPADLNENGLCSPGSYTTSITVGGKTVAKSAVLEAVFGSEFLSVQTLGDNFLTFLINLESLNLSGLENLTSIGNDFLSHCTWFNQSLALPQGLTSIGSNFLLGCALFNSPLSLPSGLNTIGQSFLYACDVFNQPLTIPNGTGGIGGSFLGNCSNLLAPITINRPHNYFTQDAYSFAMGVNTAAAYATGMTIAGPYSTEIVAAFPNSNVAPFRKLINASPEAASYLLVGTTEAHVQVPIIASDLNPNGLCNPYDGVSITVSGSTQPIAKSFILGAVFGAEFSGVTAIPDNCLKYCPNLTSLNLSGFTSLQTIGSGFLSYDTSFNAAYTLPSNLTSIGYAFMEQCTSFNKPLTIPASLTSIADNFLVRCSSFNQPLTVPASVTGVGTSFLLDCSALLSPITINCPATALADNSNSFAMESADAPAYTTGMTIAGPNADAVIARFPNSAYLPYRKLLGGTPPPPPSTSWLTLNNGTTVPITAADLNALCNNGSSVTINGQTIAKSSVVGAVFAAAEFGGAPAIPDYFLYGFTYLISPDFTGFTSLQTIGGYFLSHCSSLYGQISLPSTLTSIGYAFMELCSSFNHPLTIPASVTAVGMSFMEDCNSMVSTVTVNCPASVFTQDPRTLAVHDNTVAAYVTGITIAGSNVDAFRARFPNNDLSPWRKLLGGTPPSTSYLTLANGSTVPMTAADLTSSNGICSNVPDASATIYVGGVAVVKNTVTGAVFGAAEFGGVTAIPDNLFFYFTNLTSIAFSGFGAVTSIGSGFLFRCQSFNQPLSIWPTVTTIGADFLAYCFAFNSALTLPSGLTSIADDFLFECEAFNQPLALPSGINAIGNRFMSQCYAFNQPLTIPPVSTIGNSFMNTCSAFNQPITLPSSLTSVGYSCFMDCKNLLSPITIGVPADRLNNVPDSSFSTMDASAASYTTGMTIAGPYKDGVIARFADQTPDEYGPWRRLLASTASDSYLTKSDGTFLLTTAADLTADGLCSPDATSCTVGGVPVTKADITGAVFGTAFAHVEALPDHFLFSFTNLTGLDLSFFYNVRTIGIDFLGLCGSLNVPINISAFVTAVGRFFLYMCDSLTSPITISCPASVFETSNLSFTASSNAVPAYTQGMTIMGPSAGAILGRFPNSSTGPYRNLVDGEPQVASYIVANGTNITIAPADLTAAGLCSPGTASDATITIGGYSGQISKVTITEAQFGTAFEGVEAIPDNFLVHFTNLTALNLTGFGAVTSIGDNFMSGCSAYSAALVVPSTVTSVGVSFMFDCSSMTSLTVDCPPSGFAASDNTLSCSDNTAPAYTAGILLLGPYIAAFKERFPDRSGYPFRKLVDGAPPSGASYLVLADGTDVPITAADLPALCTSDFNSITIGGQTIYKTMIVGAVFGTEFNGVTAIPDNFLLFCADLVSLNLSGFTGLQTIGNTFLALCVGLNQPLTIPSSITAVGTGFLSSCYALLSPITINCSATVFAPSALSFALETAEGPAYTTGMTIAGPNAAAILAKFPNSDVAPFRKLLNGNNASSKKRSKK